MSGEKRAVHAVQLSRDTYRRLTKDLPLTPSGKIVPGALHDRVEKLLNDAMDRERDERKAKKNFDEQADAAGFSRREL